ncbi:nuclear transport factor 2-like isoform X2 [Magnolia sinica]|uniref:nuclear transport factor 2-like isoform X2 n=1 Tax=Magnolia sinica TaxID=86752 RepID=UPI002657F49F|nr:nuclear transport factor 2-like isoform X2 [Magnolia sinica]
MAQQQAAAGSCPSAQVVGNAFVHQYYHILHQSPELVYRFYQESSKLGRPEAEGAMSSITTMQAINEKILSLDYGECRAEIKTVDAQDSFNGGVLVLVTGYLTGKDDVKRNFTQSFFLAPQDKGYFVLNDIFRYMEDVAHPEESQGLANGMIPPLTPDHEPIQAQEERVPERTATLSEEELNVEEVYNPSDNEDGSVVEEEAPVAEVVDEIPTEAEVDAQVVADPSSIVQEEVPKKSYASIVKVKKESPAPLSVPVPAPVRSIPANPEWNVAPLPAPAPAPETPLANSNSNENGSVQEEADGYSIYIKNLPLNATSAQLEEEFKRFGPIKNGGVQVRSNKQQGFCFGFVEFEVAGAVQSAIEASPITIGGRQAFVEEKRASGSRVNSRGRFPAGRGSGGFRNEGMRGRGNYVGSRSYSRGDFNNRADYVNRGTGRGGPGRGGDGGYQRVDHMGSNGGRVNPAGGLTINAAAKTVAPRVSAPA